MSLDTLTTSPPPSSPQPESVAAGTAVNTRALGWLALVVVLMVGGPLTVCMPVWGDVDFYDVIVQTMRSGGVHYRDAFECGPPGAVWLHYAVRWLLGDSSEAMRLFDLGVTAATIWLLTRFIPMPSSGSGVRIWAAMAMFAYYLALPEMCQCSRDGWMVLPLAGALLLRVRQLGRIERAAGTASLVGWATLEGLCWGAGVLLKPYAMIPAVVVWLVSVAALRETQPRWRRCAALDFVGVFAGGTLAGLTALVYLWHSGAWQSFWDVMLGWNGEYWSRVTMSFRGLRYAAWTVQFIPWSLLHGVALPVAVIAVWRGLRGGASSHDSPSPQVPLVLAAGYLTWLAQAALLQHPHFYVLGSTVLPAIAVLAAWGRVPGRTAAGWVPLLAFCLLAYLTHPALMRHRLAVWPRCWTEGATSEMKDRLTMMQATDWGSLDRVCEFLRSQDVQDGEVTNWSTYTLPVSLKLHRQLSTRYPYFDGLLHFFPSRREEMRRDLGVSRQRFIVADLSWAGISMAEARAMNKDPLALPKGIPEKYLSKYPWFEPVAFRAGRYVVYLASGPPAAETFPDLSGRD